MKTVKNKFSILKFINNWFNTDQIIFKKYIQLKINIDDLIRDYIIIVQLMLMN